MAGIKAHIAWYWLEFPTGFHRVGSEFVQNRYTHYSSTSRLAEAPTARILTQINTITGFNYSAADCKSLSTQGEIPMLNAGFTTQGPKSRI